MPWEMLSGPDLGGGFLFQLTVERTGDRARLIYHAQEGGIDASGPPKGSPTPLGFAPTESSCPIGGSECYHRTFDLPDADVARARMAYNRLRFVVTPMLEQQYAGAEIPVRPAIDEIVPRLAEAFVDRPDGWFIGGIASAWLQGAPTPPREIDLGTDRAGAETIARALPEFLIEPLAETSWRESGRLFGARAYVGTLRSGVRVQWGVAAAGPGVRGPEFGPPPTEIATRSVDLGGRPVRFSRLEYALIAAARRHDRTAEIAIARLLAPEGADGPLLHGLVAASGLSAPDQTRLRALASP
ncbi:MAG: hypothetical protein L3K06_05155 [Thermoplasmata archaeon]|nr:hypothetical protein [Thermoplasmata archaeon]MCI4354735.1 hypothetical protein [Thermoplasmata archaeon]